MKTLNRLKNPKTTSFSRNFLFVFKTDYVHDLSADIQYFTTNLLNIENCTIHRIFT